MGGQDGREGSRAARAPNQMTTEKSANEQPASAGAPGTGFGVDGSHVAPTDDAFGLASWMRWWMQATPQAPAVPGLSISPQRLAELQGSYIKAMTAIWNDFVSHPDRAAAPIRDTRFSDPAWQENSLASFAADYLINAEFMNELAANVEGDPKTKARVQFCSVPVDRCGRRLRTFSRSIPRCRNDCSKPRAAA